MSALNPLTPNGHCSGRTAPLTSKRCILYIYSTNIILTYLVPVLFTFYIQGVIKLKKNNSGAKRLITITPSLKTNQLLCSDLNF